MIILCCLAFIYLGLQVYFTVSWQSIALFNACAEQTRFDRFSVIVPARDEEDNIETLIKSALEQNYPMDKYEIIVVDDQSTDHTLEIVNSFSSSLLKVMSLKVKRGSTVTGSKKKALTYGIAHCTGEWILTTDADCELPQDLLYSLNAFVQERDVDAIAGPVQMKSRGGFVGLLQEMDNAGMQLIQAAAMHKSHFNLGNGANLCFRKSVFNEVAGYEGNMHIASGDDVYLLQKISKRRSGSIKYLKSQQGIVVTEAVSQLKEFISQRLRWAGKMRDVRSLQMKLITFITGFFYIALIAASLYYFVFMEISKMWHIALVWFVKMTSDFVLMRSATKFFKSNKQLIWFIPMNIAHCFYYVFIGFVSLFPVTISWKDRYIRSN